MANSAVISREPAQQIKEKHTPHQLDHSVRSLRHKPQGRYCAERPVKVLAVCVLCVALAALGLLRLRVETDPQRLWVGARSQALAEKRHFEVLSDTWCLKSSIRLQFGLRRLVCELLSNQSCLHVYVRWTS